jgi:hypothetical protein
MSTIKPQLTAQDVEALGDGMYSHARLLPTGEWGIVAQHLYTYSIAIVDKQSMLRRWCFELKHHAVDALSNWDGRGDPPGPWIKAKPSERMNQKWLTSEAATPNRSDAKNFSAAQSAAEPSAAIESTYTLTYDHLSVRAMKSPRDGETVLFRLLDDDGEVYYSGFATDEHAVLDALDRKADSHGCTTAQTMIKGRYINLN